jgi:hypothetical protein
MKAVDQLLAELREHGTIDSQGQFTLSLSEARRKLVQYHSSEKARYLLLLLSAGSAAGASSVSVRQEPDSCFLSMPDAYIPESALLSAFADHGATSSVAGAGDLVLGLQGAFLAGASRVEVHSQRPGESFLWCLEPNSERSEPANFNGVSGIVIRLLFPHGLGQKLKGLLGRLRGYAARPQEARLLDQYCDRSLIPISYNGERCDRPLFLPEAGVQAVVGELSPKELGFKPDCTLSADYPFRGALALGDGAIQIVIHDVAYCQIDDLGLVGTIYHDQLERDISREKVVRDHRYDELTRQLERAYRELINHLVANLDRLDAGGLRRWLPELVYQFLSAQLLTSNRQRLWEWMEARYREGEDATRSFSPNPKGLVDLMTALLKSAQPRDRVLQELLLHCGDSLRTTVDSQLAKTLNTAHDLFRYYHPEETLVLGYLLLGLGAVHAVQQRANDSERAWFKCLETVWSGKDARAQELMYAHMGYSSAHILQQAGAALAMYCAAQTAQTA